MILVSGNLVYDTLTGPITEIRFGGTVWVDRIEGHMGGNGANTAYAAGLLGAPVRLLGMVGDDDYGHKIRERLSGAGVDLSFLMTGVHGTASSIALVRQDGARALLHRPGVSREAFAEPFSITQEMARECTHCHLANPFPLPQVRGQAPRMLREARAYGMTTSLDTGWDSLGEWFKVIEPCLPGLDLLFVNEDEARELTGTGDPELAAGFFLKAGVGCVIVKLGARGAVALDNFRRVESPAFPVAAIDTTGAGDCFVGAFLAARQFGYPVERALRLANAVAARSVSAIGSTSGLLRLDETLVWAGL